MKFLLILTDTTTPMCKKLQKLQKKSEQGLQSAFRHWSSFVARCGMCSVVLSVVICLYLQTGLRYKVREVSQEVWAPIVS